MNFLSVSPFRQRANAHSLCFSTSHWSSFPLSQFTQILAQFHSMQQPELGMSSVDLFDLAFQCVAKLLNGTEPMAFSFLKH